MNLLLQPILAFNSKLALTVWIAAIEDLEMWGEQKAFKLLIFAGDQERINLLLDLKIGREWFDITIEGED